MKVCYKDSMSYKMQQRLEQLQSCVVVRADFADLGSYRQVSRGLKALIDNSKLVKIATGLYAKAYQSPYTNKLLIENGFDGVCREALNRLGVDWEPGSAEQEYNRGETTQVPVQNIVCLKSRFRRKIGYLNSRLIYERDINAK